MNRCSPVDDLVDSAVPMARDFAMAPTSGGGRSAHASRVRGIGQTSHTLPELGDLGVEPAIHVRPQRPAAASGNVFAHGNEKLPNIFC